MTRPPRPAATRLRCLQAGGVAASTLLPATIGLLYAKPDEPFLRNARVDWPQAAAPDSAWGMAGVKKPD